MQINQGNQNAGFDIESFNTARIKEHLASRNLATDGDRNTLVQRLKEEVQKAWGQYYATPRVQQNHQYGFGQFDGRQVGQKFSMMDQGGLKKRRKKKKTKLTEEQKLQLERDLEAKREAKRLRKMEHEKRLAEAQEKKRRKKELRMQKQAETELTQRRQKEQRQRLEVFVHFDMNAFKEQLVSKLDPNGAQIASCSYDFTTKGFRVRFNEGQFAEECSFGSTMDHPKTIEVPNACKIMRAPIESHCVFFLDPCQVNHPGHSQAVEFIQNQSTDRVNMSEMKSFHRFRDSAKAQFAKYGVVTNIYRERGFMVVQFQESESAQQMYNDLHAGGLDSKGALNGINIVYFKQGTPRKKDRKECDEKFPHPTRRSKKKGGRNAMEVEIKGE